MGVDVRLSPPFLIKEENVRLRDVLVAGVAQRARLLAGLGNHVTRCGQKCFAALGLDDRSHEDNQHSIIPPPGLSNSPASHLLTSRPGTCWSVSLRCLS